MNMYHNFSNIVRPKIYIKHTPILSSKATVLSVNDIDNVIVYLQHGMNKNNLRNPGHFIFRYFMFHKV